MHNFSSFHNFCWYLMLSHFLSMYHFPPIAVSTSSMLIISSCYSHRDLDIKFVFSHFQRKVLYMLVLSLVTRIFNLYMHKLPPTVWWSADPPLIWYGLDSIANETFLTWDVIQEGEIRPTVFPFVLVFTDSVGLQYILQTCVLHSKSEGS